MKVLYWKNFGNIDLNKRGLRNKYGLLIVQPLFLEASRFPIDTSGHCSSTFIFERIWKEESMLCIYQLFDFSP